MADARAATAAAEARATAAEARATATEAAAAAARARATAAEAAVQAHPTTSLEASLWETKRALRRLQGQICAGCRLRLLKDN